MNDAVTKGRQLYPLARSLGTPLAIGARSTSRMLAGYVYPPTSNIWNHDHGQNRYTRCPHPQPEKHRPRYSPGQTDGDHRLVRLGQILAGIRHPVCRRPAPLCRIAVGLCAAIFVDDGKTRRRPYRRLVAGDFHRTKIDLAQSALNRRHHHRNLRLPALAVCARRRAALPRSRYCAGGTDRQPDGRQRTWRCRKAAS